MDTEMIKEIANSVNNVVVATAKPLNEQIAKLKAENKRLQEALVIYGHHGRTDNTTMCEHMKHTDYPCTCGFEQALKGDEE